MIKYAIIGVLAVVGFYATIIIAFGIFMSIVEGKDQKRRLEGKNDY